MLLSVPLSPELTRGTIVTAKMPPVKSIIPSIIAKIDTIVTPNGLDLVLSNSYPNIPVNSAT